jgi:hypothetical protein
MIALSCQVPPQFSRELAITPALQYMPWDVGFTLTRNMTAGNDNERWIAVRIDVF